MLFFNLSSGILFVYLSEMEEKDSNKLDVGLQSKLSKPYGGSISIILFCKTIKNSPNGHGDTESAMRLRLCKRYCMRLLANSVCIGKNIIIFAAIASTASTKAVCSEVWVCQVYESK